jgi:hypothetical protein
MGRLDSVAAVVLALWLVLAALILGALVFLAKSAPTDDPRIPLPTSVPGPPVRTP